MAYAFISTQNRLASPNLNYVWDTNLMDWVKETQPGGGGGGGGDASAANQVIGNASLASIDSKTPALSGGSVPVVVTSPVSTKTDLTPSTPTAATVGVASAQALAANANRKGLVLVNTSINRISLGFGSAAVLDSGITLYPMGSFEMDEYLFDLGAVNAIASAASSNLAIQELTT